MRAFCVKNGLEDWKDGSVDKVLAMKHGTELDTQHPAQKWWVQEYIPAIPEDRGGSVPGACWPACLVELMNSGFSESPYFTK